MKNNIHISDIVTARKSQFKSHKTAYSEETAIKKIIECFKNEKPFHDKEIHDFAYFIVKTAKRRHISAQYNSDMKNDAKKISTTTAKALSTVKSLRNQLSSTQNPNALLISYELHLEKKICLDDVIEYLEYIHSKTTKPPQKERMHVRLAIEIGKDYQHFFKKPPTINKNHETTYSRICETIGEYLCIEEPRTNANSLMPYDTLKLASDYINTLKFN